MYTILYITDYKNSTLLFENRPLFSGGGGNFPLIFSVSRIDSWCISSVLEFIALSWNGGRPYVKFKFCPCAIYSCVIEKKGYSCYITFPTNFILIYWTRLIGFGGKFHRSCNLAHTVRDLD